MACLPDTSGYSEVAGANADFASMAIGGRFPVGL